MHWLFIILILVSVSGGDPACFAATPGAGQAATGGQTVKGHIQNIEGEMYSVRDQTGHEVQLRITKETKVEGGLKPKVGDRIEAQVTADGQATSIVLMIPDAGPPSAGKQPPTTVVP